MTGGQDQKSPPQSLAIPFLLFVSAELLCRGSSYPVKTQPLAAKSPALSPSFCSGHLCIRPLVTRSTSNLSRLLALHLLHQLLSSSELGRVFQCHFSQVCSRISVGSHPFVSVQRSVHYRHEVLTGRNGSSSRQSHQHAFQ